MESVGVYLKKEREAKDISLGEVARLTKISKFYLDYIERDEFEKLPQGPYIKGYISSYSEQIGSDVDEALKLYDALNEKEKLTHTVVPDDWETEEDGFSSEIEKDEETNAFFSNLLKTNSFSILRTTVYGSMTVLIATIFVLAGFGFYHLFLFDNTMPARATSEPPVAQTTKQETAANPVDLKQTERVNLANATGPQQRPVTEQKEATIEPERPIKSAVAFIPFEDIATAADFLVDKAYAEDLTEKIPMAEVPAPIEPEEPQVSASLKVLKASVCSDVQDRIPVGVSTVFPSSTKRVYVWNQVEAEQIPSEIHHIYYFEGRKISEVKLKVRSNFWRTWSYKTLPAGDPHGQWHVDIAMADGTLLKRLDFTVN
jgi:cytoskeletal protein RodZ